MSLVHEALQKAEKEKQRKTVATPLAPASVTAPTLVDPPSPATPPTTATAPLSSAPRRAPMFAAAIITLSVMAIAVIVWPAHRAATTSRLMEKALSGKRTVTPASRTPADQDASPAAPPPAATPSAIPYKLTGIVRLPDGAYTAVVNGQAVDENHSVDGAIVKRIVRDRVTLDVDGRTVVLRLY